jgi:hypothetical protein
MKSILKRIQIPDEGLNRSQESIILYNNQGSNETPDQMIRVII